MKKLKIIVLAMVIAAIYTGTSFGAVNEFKARINVAFQDRTVMFYVGANAGLVPGEKYAVYSNGYRIATVQLTRVDAYSANGIVVEADNVLSEGIIYTFKYMSGSEQMITSEPRSLIKPIEDDKAKKKDTKAKDDKKKDDKKKDKDLAQDSSRRRQATKDDDKKKDDGDLKKKDDKKKKDTKKDTKKKDTKKDKKDDKKKEEPKKEEKKKAAPAGDKTLNSSSSFLGFSGLNLMPTADTITQNKARISVGFKSDMSASTGFAMADTTTTYIGIFNLNQKSRTIDFTYGITEQSEFYVATTDMDRNMGLTMYDQAAPTTVVSVYSPLSVKRTSYGFKYSFPLAWNKDKTEPTHKLAAMLSWDKARIRDSGSFSAAENVTEKYMTYGIAGSFQVSELARGHVYYGKQKLKETGVSASTDSTTNTIMGYAVEYTFDPKLSVMLEYLTTSEGNGTNSEDTDITEKSIGFRYKYRPNLHLDLSWTDYEVDLSDVVSGMTIGDKYYSLKLNYQI